MTTRYNVRVANGDTNQLNSLVRSGGLRRQDQPVSGMTGGEVYVPQTTALAQQDVIHDSLLRLGNTTLTTELNRIPGPEHALLVAGSPGYMQYAQQQGLAHGLLAPMTPAAQTVWINTLVATTVQGRAPGAPGPVISPSGTWLPEETRLVCQGGLWFLSLGFEVPAILRTQRQGLMGVDVGLAPLAVAAGHGGQVLTTRPLYLLDQAGHHALNTHLDRLSPAQSADVQTRYAALVYGAAQAELAALTAQLVGCAGNVAVEALRFGSFRSNFVERARELAVADWLQGVLPQRLYAASGRLYRVSPAHTSSRCHRCNQTGQRAGALFTCTTCGVFNAHHNAALNIRRRAWGVIRRGRP